MSNADFINKVAPMFQKYGAQYKFHIISFAIAQACYESGYGTSYAAQHYSNILGIGPHKHYSSWDACVKGYYTDTVLGGMKSARDATTLDQYYQAFVKSNYCPGTEAQYYSAIKSIISSYNLTKYDSKNNQTLASPEPNKLQQFLDTAAKHANGERFSDWAGKVLGIPGDPDWCAYFVCACAKEVGVLGKIIANVGWVDGIIDSTASQCKGKIHLASSSYVPKPGDLVTWKSAGSSSGYHVGIVNKVSGNTLYTFEGNHTDRRSAKVEHSLKESDLYRYCHPDWESVGGVSSGSDANGVSSSGGGSLYSSEYTRADAILRDVAYINSKSERTTAPSGIHLSVMNYTTMLSDLWRLFGYDTGTTSEDSSDTSSLSGKAKTVIDYLISKGLNAAAACGVAGNIFYESTFNPGTIGDHGTSFGICQWHEGRGVAMKKYVGSNWSTNLTGQLDYLWHELQHNYPSVFNYLKSVPNTSTGTKNAADYFVRHFEIPDDISGETVKRQAKASEYFNQIRTGGTVSDGTTTGKQNKVINAANVTPSPGAGLCAAWVTNVFINAGIGSFYGNACDLYRSYCKSKNKSDLKPGMIISVDSWNGNSDSITYGHVGIYIGNNTVRHNIGSIINTSLSSWISQYESWPSTHPAKWGWMGNVVLT